MTSDPIRLLSSGSSATRALLESAALDVPTDAQLLGLAAKLASLPTAGATTAAVTTSGSGAAGAGVAGKLAVLAAGLGALGTAAVLWIREPAAPPSPPPSPSRIASPLPAVPPPVIEAVAPAVELPPEPTVKAAPLPRKEPRREKPATEAPAPVAAPVPDEAAVLARAQEALRRGDAVDALRTAEQHAAAFATGSFVQEREAIAIEALVRLDRRDAARARLNALLAAFPRTAYGPRLQRLVDR